MMFGYCRFGLETRRIWNGMSNLGLLASCFAPPAGMEYVASTPENSGRFHHRRLFVESAPRCWVPSHHCGKLAIRHDSPGRVFGFELDIRFTPQNRGPNCDGSLFEEFH
jgi:hypothetical protein